MFSMIGSVVSAVFASACCWLPLLLLAAGMSGAAVAAAFERYRPAFLSLSFALLGAAFYFAYRPASKWRTPLQARKATPAARQSESLAVQLSRRNGRSRG